MKFDKGKEEENLLTYVLKGLGFLAFYTKN